MSTRNSAYQVLESLRSNRQTRRRTQTFLLEGVQPLTRALAHGWTFDAVLFARGARLSSWASDVITRSRAPVRYEVAPDLLAGLSGKTDTSELLAVVRMPRHDAGRIPLVRDLLVVTMDAPSSPGNLGTVVRSADALGAHGVIVTGHAADVYDPATITASRGSLFAIPVVHVEGPRAVDEWLAQVRRTLGTCSVVGADEKGAVDLASHDFRGPTVVVLGNEARGLAHGYRAMCDTTLKIPMQGSASSLNVGVAASIILYEAARQRRSP